MKTLGLIGGMSWHSTIEYYRWINEEVARTLGGHSSARISLQSVDFAEIRDCQENEQWDRAGEILTEAGRRCQAGGADVVAICTNLMHKVAPAVEAAIDVPMLHIGDAIADAATAQGFTRLGILGTRWTMQETFYSDRLARHGIESAIPDDTDCLTIDRIIWDELTQGIITEQSRQTYVGIIEKLADQGCRAVVLGCTEINLLIQPEHSPIPCIDSASTHAHALAKAALA